MMTFDSSLKQEDLLAAQLVAKRVELEDVLMMSGSFSLKRICTDIKSVVVADNISISHRYEFTEPSSTLTVFVHFVCDGIVDNDTKHSDEQNASVFEASATFMLQYMLTVEPPPEEKRDDFFLGFAKINGVYNAWPYLREFVRNSAARSGLNGMVLPVFRVPQLATLAKPASPP